MKTVAAWLFARLSEPSTFAGLATLVTVGHTAFLTHDYQSLAATTLALGAMLFREAGAQS
jgi:hypothetical protein